MALFDLDRSGNPVRLAWDRLSPLPGGRRLFSWVIGRTARYTGSIRATVEALGPGEARVRMSDRPAVRNHLRSVHAVALTNLAELTGNIALLYGLPDDARFIIRGMSIEFHKKARGPITGHARFAPPTTSETIDLDIPVRLLNGEGVEVATATMHSRVGPKPPPR